MLPLARLEDEPKSGAIYVDLFYSAILTGFFNRESNRLHTNTLTSDTDFSPGIKAAIGFYDLAGRILLPFLGLNKRLLAGWDQRRLKVPPPRADFWLQAASAGEAYLAREIINTLTPPNPIQVLVTTNTSQGMEILAKTQADLHAARRDIRMTARYFPFDRPRIMKAAVDAIRPRLVGLLETELWPGLLAVLKAMGIPAIMINGRINRSSLKRYMLWPAFWRSLAPDRIMAISSRDVEKFGRLFDQSHISVMPNIKFDHWYRQLQTDTDTGRLERLFEPDRSLAVFGSVRREEEKQVQAMIARIFTQVPEAIIAIFPRHMDRLSQWQAYLNRDGVSWVIRSRVDGTVKKGTVVLWDTFGELRDAYAMATAAFVGGSLAPLGGQNFLEPLACGVLPVIGPSYHNFRWVGETIFKERLVCQAVNWAAAAEQMIANLKNPVSHGTVCRRAERYAHNRTGGTRQACRVIENYLN